MNAFWWKRSGKGLYEIGMGSTICVVVTCPDEDLGAQWAQCCANALNARERALRGFIPNDLVCRADGTIDEAASNRRQEQRYRFEANSD